MAEADLNLFVKEQGTGTEIPPPPKFIDFYQGGAPPEDVDDSSDHDDYGPTQHQKSLKSSMSGPSTPGPSYDISKDTASRDIPDDAVGNTNFYSNGDAARSQSRVNQRDIMNEHNIAEPLQTYVQASSFQIETIGPITNALHSRESLRDGARSPTKAGASTPSSPSKSSPRKGFFSNSPFRRRSKHGNVHDSSSGSPRSPWIKPGANPPDESQFDDDYIPPETQESEPSSDPVDPRANFQLNVGNNVFDIASPDKRKPPAQSHTKPANESEAGDPMVQALADLKGSASGGDRNKSLRPTRSSLRMNTDRNQGLPTPTMSALSPGADPNTTGPQGSPYGDAAQAKRLDAPKPAYTSAQMQRTTQNYAGRTQGVFNQAMVPPTPTSPMQMQSGPPPRAPSPQKQWANPQYVAAGGQQPAPLDRRGSRVDMQRGQQQNPYARHTSPGPGARLPIQTAQGNMRPGADPRGQRYPPRGSFSPQQHQHPYVAEPGAYGRPSTQQSMHMPRGGPTYQPYNHTGSVSSQPQYASSRPPSGHGMGLQMADFAPDDGYRGPNRGTWGSPHSHSTTSRSRAQSFVTPERQPKVSSDGRPILHLGEYLINSFSVHHPCPSWLYTFAGLSYRAIMSY